MFIRQIKRKRKKNHLSTPMAAEPLFPFLPVAPGGFPASPRLDGLDACARGDVGTLELMPRAGQPRLFWSIAGDGSLVLTSEITRAAHFRLLLHRRDQATRSAVVSLQEPRGGSFVSPTLLKDVFAGFTLRSNCDAWGMLSVTSHRDGTWSFQVRGTDTGDDCIFSPQVLADGAPLIRRSAAPEGGWERWLFRLSNIPVVDVSALACREMRATLAAAQGVDELPAAVKTVVARLGKAARDV